MGIDIGNINFKVGIGMPVHQVEVGLEAETESKVPITYTHLSRMEPSKYRYRSRAVR